MQWQLLWFVLAGFLFGFAVSTLWEWLYFRQRHAELENQRIRELEAERQRMQEEKLQSELMSAPWPEQTYRSSVYIGPEEAEPYGELPPEEETEPKIETSEEETIVAIISEPEPGEETAEPTPYPMEEAEPQQPIDHEEERAVLPDEVETRPEPYRLPFMARRTVGYPDDLSRVKGVGKNYRRRLYEAGIFTWHQMSQTDPDTLRSIARPRVSANVEEWPDEARTLAEKYHRVGATYVGPLPDDLTEIPGIGAAAIGFLYKAGICTFEQLSNVPSERLIDVLPLSPTGKEIDYAGIVERAAKLARPEESSP